MTRRSILPPLLGVLVTILLATACSGGEEEKPAGLIEPAWTADSVSAFADRIGTPWTLEERGNPRWLNPTERLVSWVSGNVVAIPSQDEVAAYDIETGKEQWRLSAPPDSTFCAASRGINSDGIGGLGLTDKKGACSSVTAVDLASGRLLWTEQIGFEIGEELGNESSIGVGDDLLTVAMPDTGVARFALASGKVQPSLVPREDSIEQAVAADGIVVVRTNRYGEDDTITVYDADTGRPVSRAAGRSASDRGGNSSTELNGIASTEPLILDLTSVNHPNLQVHTEGGGPQLMVGKSGEAGEVEVLGISDGVLAVSYDRIEGVVYGYDTETGEELWATTLEKFETPVGVQAGGLLTVSTWRSLDDPGPGVWLRRTDLRDPEHEEALGLMEISGLAAYAWHDDVLLTFDGERLRGFKLPAPGSPPAPTPDWVADERPTWEAGDVRPEDVVDACEAVRPATLELLGIRRTKRLVPASCSWGEYGARDDVSLDVDVSVDEPHLERTAVEMAQSWIDDNRRSHEQANRRPEAVPSLGEEAWLTRQTDGPDDDTIYVISRCKNVSVKVRVTASTDGGQARDVPDADVEAAARTAVADVLGDLPC